MKKKTETAKKTSTYFYTFEIWMQKGSNSAQINQHITRTEASWNSYKTNWFFVWGDWIAFRINLFIFFRTDWSIFGFSYNITRKNDLQIFDKLAICKWKQQFELKKKNLLKIWANILNSISGIFTMTQTNKQANKMNRKISRNCLIPRSQVFLVSHQISTE